MADKSSVYGIRDRCRNRGSADWPRCFSVSVIGKTPVQRFNKTVYHIGLKKSKEKKLGHGRMVKSGL